MVSTVSAQRLSSPVWPAGAQSAAHDRRTKNTADGLVRDHMSLVRKLAWHVHGRVSSAMDVEDLIQTGMVALIEAARSYEERGHAFATYATMRIRGSMIDGLRRGATQGRAAMGKRRAISAARNKFEQTFGRVPVDAEMAETLGLDLRDYHAQAEAARGVRHDSIDDLYSDHSLCFADNEARADELIENAQLQRLVADAIRRLPTREALVLQQYFVDELSLDAIGEMIGVGPARVCQIKKSALDKVRQMVGN
jgi:RNA polymerase sigma factor FliA